MEAVREIVDGSALATVVSLPAALHSRKVEVIVFPVTDAAATPSNENAHAQKITRARLDELKKGSRLMALRGAIPHPPTTIAEIREERLGTHYGHLDRQ
jgi:hypothetical protein